MQPFVNPNYFSGQVIKPQIHGKYIASTDEILMSDIPMDGTQAVFVKNDLSEIYTRGWKSDGTIISRSYMPQIVEIENEVDNDKGNEINVILDEIQAKLERIEERLEKLNEHKRNYNDGSRQSNVNGSPKAGTK